MAEAPFPSEDALQTATANFLHLACPPGGDVIWWHTPNGGKRSMSTAVRLKGMGVLAGVPDLIFIWRAPMRFGKIEIWPYNIAFIELKRFKIGHLKGAQLLFQRWCDRLGIPHAVCWSLDGIEATLRGWGVPLKATLGGKHV